jgi:phenylpropionate dioxygenase-like ring-hydroxylating dioxygenase large terminal subunit
MVQFLRNAWYAVTWAEDFADAPRAARVLGLKIALYRAADGRPVALGDVCPHRFAPLHRGIVMGDAIECPYHGLRFGPHGRCVHNPHGETIPEAARVRSFPAIERHGLIWLWPGDAVLADPARIPDFSHLTAPGYRTIRGDYTTAAYYETFTDNLMDLTHTQFLHRDIQGTDAFLKAERSISIEGTTARLVYRCPPGLAPGLARRFLPNPEATVETSLEMRWDAPSLMRLTVSVDPVDRSHPPHIHVGTHILTPETENETHYFYAASRTYERDNAALDEANREWHRIGFGLQDKPMIEAVHANMGTADLMALKPVLLASDVGVMQVRRLLQQLVRGEQAAAASGPVAAQ